VERYETPYEVEHKKKLHAIEESRKRHRDRWRQLLVGMMQDKTTREFLSTYFDMSYLHLNPYTGNADSGFICGLQNAARELVIDCQHADFELYMTMEKERIQREEARNAEKEA
jgi:hypothetical protein